MNIEGQSPIVPPAVAREWARPKRRANLSKPLPPRGPRVLDINGDSAD